jgi:hypothetical protein
MLDWHAGAASNQDTIDILISKVAFWTRRAVLRLRKRDRNQGRQRLGRPETSGLICISGKVEVWVFENTVHGFHIRKKRWTTKSAHRVLYKCAAMKDEFTAIAEKKFGLTGVIANDEQISGNNRALLEKHKRCGKTSEQDCIGNADVDVVCCAKREN